MCNERVIRNRVMHIKIQFCTTTNITTLVREVFGSYRYRYLDHIYIYVEFLDIDI